MPSVSAITRTLHVSASPAEVWDALTNPAKTPLFMFNCEVISDWQPGSTIHWKGNYQGYESGERGTILEVEKQKKLKYTSFDPNFGLADEEKNYLHITYELQPENEGTVLTTTIENFNGDETRTGHIAKGWDGIVLPALQQLLNSK